MDARRREAAPVMETPAAPQAVYVPQNVRAGVYRQLMQRHDRMGTRHI